MSDDEDDNENSIKLVFNDDGKIAYGGLLDFDVKSFKFHFTDEELQILRNDCKAAFTSRAQRKGRYSTGSTFFLRADEKPMCVLEQLAMSIFRKHSQNATYVEKRSGCEWWTLVLDAEDDVGFHFDRDYGLESDYDTFIYPHIATVTYLSDIGASTVVMNATSDFDTQSPVISQPNELFICKPCVGKHLSFGGRLLHGAPVDLTRSVGDTNDSVRVTFLVNIWLNHIPIKSKRITKKYLKCLNSAYMLNTTISSNEEVATIDCGSSSLDGSLSWEFPDGKSFHRVTVPRPNTPTSTLIGSCSSVARVVLSDGAISIEEVNGKKRKRS